LAEALQRREVVQEDIEEGAVDVQVAILVDEAQLSKFI
jgi:hypothetical protein